MLKIGEFSALTGISIHMLRNYDKIGLLKPEMVERNNNYRFYGEKQIVRANYILVLKGLGFALQEITEILTEDKPDDSIKNFLENKIREKEERLAVINKQITQMKQALDELDLKNEFTLSVSIKKLPARCLVSVRGIIQDFGDEGILWERLDQLCKKNAVKLADTHYSIAITHSFDLEKKKIDTEVFKIVEQPGAELAGLRFSDMPETEAAVVAFQGVYSRIGEINQYVYRWIEENGYRMAGKDFTVYYLSPENESNPENFISEICYPVTQAS